MYFLQKDKINEFINRNIIALFLDTHHEVVFLEYIGKNKLIGVVNGKRTLIILFNSLAKQQIYKDVYHTKTENVIIYYDNKIKYYEKGMLLKIPLKKEFIEEYKKLLNNPYEYIIKNFIEREWEYKYKILFNFEKEKVDNKYLYKYKAFPTLNVNASYNDRGEEIKKRDRFQEFIDGKICYSSPKYFNDPYDCDCLLPDIESMSRLISNTLRQTNFYLHKGQYISSKQIIEVLSAYKNEESIINDIENIYRKILSYKEDFRYHYKLYKCIDIYKNSIEAIKDLKDYFKVLCLGNTYNDILMWGYYADGGNGVCCSYKEESIREKTKEKYPHNICVYGKVEYSDEKPSYKAAYTSEKDSIWQYVIDCVFTKFKRWEHEGEYRFVILCPQKNDSPYLVDVYPKDYYIGVNFKDESICFKKDVACHKLKKDKNKYLLKI